MPVTVYCTPAQLLQRYDARTIGQLVNDDGTSATVATLTSSSTGSVLYSHLQSASGKIEAALLASERYQLADLQTIAGIDPNDSGNSDS